MVQMLLKTYRPILIAEIVTVSEEKISFATAERLEGGTCIVAPTATLTLEEEKQNHLVTNATDLPPVLFERRGPLESLATPILLVWKRISVSAAGRIICLRPSFISHE